MRNDRSLLGDFSLLAFGEGAFLPETGAMFVGTASRHRVVVYAITRLALAACVTQKR